MSQLVVRAPGGGEQFINPLGARVVIRITGAETNGLYTVIEAEQPAGIATAAPLHTHDKEDEAIQVLEGHLVIEVDGIEHQAPTGSYILIPKGAAQTFWNPGPGPARYQSIFSPSGQEDYFREAYSLDRSDVDYPKKLADIRSRYGLRYPRKDP